MKVAYLIGSLHRGGAETLIFDVFQQWHSAPFEMMLIHRCGGALKDELYAAGPKCFELTPRRGRYISYLLRLRKLICQQHVDIIHAQYWLDAIYAKLATIGLNIPIVLTFHGYFFQKGWQGLGVRLAIRMSNRICFVSETEKKDFEKFYGKILDGKSYLIYNGVDFGKFDIDYVGGDLEKSDNHVNLCMVGNFLPGRNQLLICEALKKLRNVNISFYFVGRRSDLNPELYNRCVQFCKDNSLFNVHFLGSRGDVPTILRQMDGFVYSAVRDTFGIAVLEAMAVGLPVVVNDLPIMKEIGGNAQSVLFYKTNDVSDCAEKICKLLSELIGKRHLAQQTKSEVREKFSIENHIQHLTEIYNI